MATAELRLSLPVDAARDAVAHALSEQGFTVQPTASGSLDVSRGSLGTTLVAGAFAGQDMHVRFDVHLSPVTEGTLAAFEHSAVGGFFKGGAIGAAKAGDVVREAAHRAGARLAQQGVLVGSVPDGGTGFVAPGSAPSAADASAPPASAPPVPETPPGEAASAGAAPISGAGPEFAAVGAPAPTTPSAAGYPGAAGGYPGYAGPAGGYPGAADPSGGSAYGAPASPYAATGASDRTNGIAILAIILGFVLPIGGIVAGAVALAQIKRTGEKGRGLAIGGIIAGSVITALTFLVGIAFLIFTLVVGATTSSADPFIPALPDGGGVTIAPNDQAPDDAYTLAVGSCLDEIPSGVIKPSNVVACDSPHVYEVFGSFFLTDGAFPGTDAIDSAVFDGCDAAFASYVGIPYENSILEYSYVAPDESTWADGDREVSCLLYDPNVTETTGSLADSAR